MTRSYISIKYPETTKQAFKVLLQITHLRNQISYHSYYFWPQRDDISAPVAIISSRDVCQEGESYSLLVMITKKVSKNCEMDTLLQIGGQLQSD